MSDADSRAADRADGVAVHRGAALAVLCAAVFVINVDSTIVNIALPALVRQLGASTRDLQWVVDAYNLTFAALVLAAGSLGDRYGRKGRWSPVSASSGSRPRSAGWSTRRTRCSSCAPAWASAPR